MSYYSVLGLEKEPFSTSPDPEFFYESQEHHAALMRSLIELRLQRGLSLILGDVGTGKTTLSRKLYQLLRERDDIVFHMILDPAFETEDLFLDALVRTFQVDLRSSSPSILDLKEAIKDYLFEIGVKEKKTVVLLIDEAQKLNSASLEALRVLLNYETNEYKLLQLILMGQMEILPRVREIPNLWDRINLKYVINPFDEEETKKMIEFRIRKAGGGNTPYFSKEAVNEIYKVTKGYPRRISKLCHNALRSLVMKNKSMVEAEDIRELEEEEIRIAQL
jgi:general secretion pathway protein A